jgi:hypothetical protein
MGWTYTCNLKDRVADSAHTLALHVKLRCNYGFERKSFNTSSNLKVTCSL